jgi:hypothetical protein
MRLARRELLILGAAGVTAAAAGALVGALALQSRSGAATLLAQTFLDTAGKPRRLQEWQGRVIVCNFWATWCAPCREEIPLLKAAQHNSPLKTCELSVSASIRSTKSSNSQNRSGSTILFSLPRPKPSIQ